MELNENKCSAVLRAKVQWKSAAGQTKADKLTTFASGQPLLPCLPLVKLYYLTFEAINAKFSKDDTNKYDTHTLTIYPYVILYHGEP